MGNRKQKIQKGFLKEVASTQDLTGMLRVCIESMVGVGRKRLSVVETFGRGSVASKTTGPEGLWLASRHPTSALCSSFSSSR